MFALTYKPGFFEKQGFRLANVMEFPQKVWNECVRCPFFTNCKEVAVVLDLGTNLSVPLAADSPSCSRVRTCLSRRQAAFRR